MTDFDAQWNAAMEELKKKNAGTEPKTPDPRPYRAPQRVSDIEERNAIRKKWGQPLIEEKKAEPNVEEEKEEPIHPENGMSGEMLQHMYGDNIYRGYTKAQLEETANLGRQEAINELQRRRVLELERDNKAQANEHEAKLREIEAREQAAMAQAESDVRIQELTAKAKNGEVGAVGEILKLKGKL